MTSPSARLLGALDPEQRSAAEALHGPVCVLAGAGTGKTTAITHRIAYGVASGVYSPQRVMALTFTARSAAELRSRLRTLGAGGVAARTFHAAALSQLGYFWPQVIGGFMPRILESKGRVIAQAAEAVGLTFDTAALRDLAAEIEWRKVSRLTYDQYAEAAATRTLPGGIAIGPLLEVHQAYERIKDERRQIDFEDVLLATAGMLETEPRVAVQVREQYRFFVVDEFQDVSPLQEHLLGLWLGEREDLCVVGDASQTIYSFAGASSAPLLSFPVRYPNATVVTLETNYRSTAPIIATANRLMRGRPGALTLTPAPPNTDTPARKRAAEPEITSHLTDSAEARAVAQQVADDIGSGTAPQDIAVLYRVNAQAALLESAFGDAGIPFQLRGATRFFELPEVKQALMMIKGATVAAVAEPLFKTVSDVLRSLGWSQNPPETRGAVRDRWESLNAIMGMAEAAAPGTTLRQFSDELAERASSQHEPTLAAVTLATVHSAKGLEWDSVYVVGVSEGYFPIMYATDSRAVDEERRLLYVALTRARRRLSISWTRSGYGRGSVRQPSRFLEELRSRTQDAPAPHSR